MYRAKYETEFDLVGIIIEKFILVVQGKLDIDTSNSDEQRIIKTLLSHDTLISFIVAHIFFLFQPFVVWNAVIFTDMEQYFETESEMNT